MIFKRTQVNLFAHIYMISNSYITNNSKWFQVLLCNTKNSFGIKHLLTNCYVIIRTKHLSFLYTQLNVQTVQFLRIQFNISNLYLLEIEP